MELKILHNVIQSAHNTCTEYISNTRCERDIFGSKTKRVVAIHIHSLLGAGTGSKQVKSIKVGQEGGTNQVKMIKIDTANGCSPPVSNQKHHTQ